ncbi:MAG: right-handed parallel beta-helix repeat-containing protein [bacterium]
MREPAWNRNVLPVISCLAILCALLARSVAAAGADVPDRDGTTLVYANRVFIRDLRIRLNRNNVIIRNCTFRGASLRVQGRGDLVVQDTIFDHPGTLGMSIRIDGAVLIDSVEIFGRGRSPDGNLYSGLTIHGATDGGLIANVRVSDFPGNGILLEAETLTPIVGVAIQNVEIYRCRGGLWLFNTRNCVVDGLYAESCSYRPHPRHELGQLFPCILDERLVDGSRVRGDSEIENVVCQ